MAGVATHALVPGGVGEGDLLAEGLQCLGLLCGRGGRSGGLGLRHLLLGNGNRHGLDRGLRLGI
jgi:hypothetical protein